MIATPAAPAAATVLFEVPLETPAHGQHFDLKYQLKMKLGTGQALQLLRTNIRDARLHGVGTRAAPLYLEISRVKADLTQLPVYAPIYLGVVLVKAKINQLEEKSGDEFDALTLQLEDLEFRLEELAKAKIKPEDEAQGFESGQKFQALVTELKGLERRLDALKEREPMSTEDEQRDTLLSLLEDMVFTLGDNSEAILTIFGNAFQKVMNGTVQSTKDFAGILPEYIGAQYPAIGGRDKPGPKYIAGQPSNGGPGARMGTAATT